MRKALRETADIERSYIEAHISSVVAIGIEYGFDVYVDRYSSCTVVSLRQLYMKSPRAMDGVEVTFYHDRTAVYIERVVMLRGANHHTRSDCGSYEDYDAEALEHIVRIVWDIETE